MVLVGALLTISFSGAAQPTLPPVTEGQVPPSSAPTSSPAPSSPPPDAAPPASPPAASPPPPASAPANPNPPGAAPPAGTPPPTDPTAPTSSKAPPSTSAPAGATTIPQPPPSAPAPTGTEPTSSKAPPSRQRPTELLPGAPTPVPTATPAPTPTPTPAAAPAPTAPPAAEDEGDEQDVVFRHRGPFVELAPGVLGCTRTACADNHAAKPGFRLSGTFGWNVFGVLELGIHAGWARLGSGDTSGRGVLSLYELDAQRLQDEIGAAVDLTALVVDKARLTHTTVAPVVRLHVIPRGRVMAYAGIGAGWSRFRGRYVTAIGDADIDFHGVVAPIHGGIGVFVHPKVALIATGNYLWTYNATAVIKHPDETLFVPLPLVEDALDIDLIPQLPHFWAVDLALRFRFGK